MDKKPVDLHNYQRMNRLWRGQVLPRLWDKCFPAKVIIPCAVIGTGLGFLLGVLPGGSISIFTLASHGTTYATASLALCLTVLVLIIGLPGQNRVREWARRNRRDGESNSYTELVFSVLWAALAQMGFLIACWLNILFGGELPVVPDGIWISHRIALSASLTFAAYAIAELHSVLATVSQLAVVMVREARQEEPSGSSDSNGTRESSPDLNVDAEK